MKRYLLLFFLFWAMTCFGQRKDSDSTVNPKSSSKKNLEYFFNIQSGSLIGSNDSDKGKEITFTTSTIHGITVGKKFRAGLGAGFDSYENWQTIPVFAVASWDLIGNKNKNAVYLQMTYGWSQPWFVKSGLYQYYWSDPFTGVSGGRMINPSIGYRVKYYNLKLSFAVGYKFQRLSYNQQYYYCETCDVNYLLPAQPLEINHDFKRVQVIMSVGWK